MDRLDEAACEAAWDIRMRDPDEFVRRVEALPASPVRTYLQARIAEASGAADECLALCDEALSGVEEMPLWRARVLETRGNILNALGVADKAQEQLAAAWDIYERIGDLVGRASVRQNSSTLTFQDADTQLLLLREAFEIAEEAGRDDLRGVIRVNMASAAQLIGLPREEVQGYLREAKTLLADSWPAMEVRVRCFEVEEALAAGEVDMAEQVAATLPDPVQVPAQAVRVHVAGALADLALVTDRPGDAVSTLEQVLAMSAFEEDRVELEFKLATALRACGRLQEALDVHERNYTAMTTMLTDTRRVAGRALDVWHRTSMLRQERAAAEDRAATLEQALDELGQAMDRIHELSVRDTVTGLHNRQYLMSEGPALLAVHAGGPAAVALLDLDRFKDVNDAYGHQTGDRVLQAFGRALRDGMRDDDLVSRHGGEEFVVVRAAKDAEGRPAMLSLAADLEALIVDLAQMPWGEPGQPPLPRVSFSAGVTHAGCGGLGPTLSRADRLLYAAKAAGRHRVVVEGAALPG